MNNKDLFNDLCKKVQANLFKVIVIGDTGVGKTALISKIIENKCGATYSATVGVDCCIKRMVVDNEVCRLQLWDISGQERFGQMTRVFYKDAIGALVVFDCTRKETFNSVKIWKNDLDSKVSLPNGSPIPSILLGNKCDLTMNEDCSIESLHKFATENKFLSSFKTSATKDVNIEAAILELTRAALNVKCLYPYIEVVRDSQTFNLSERIEQIEESANIAIELGERNKKFCSCR